MSAHGAIPKVQSSKDGWHPYGISVKKSVLTFYIFAELAYGIIKGSILTFVYAPSQSKTC